MKKETTYLNNYFTGCKTGAERSVYSDVIINEENNDQIFEYWKINGYFRILDCVIMGLKNRFTRESLTVGVSIDHFMKLEYNESLAFIEQYKV